MDLNLSWMSSCTQPKKIQICLPSANAVNRARAIRLAIRIPFDTSIISVIASRMERSEIAEAGEFSDGGGSILAKDVCNGDDAEDRGGFGGAFNLSRSDRVLRVLLASRCLPSETRASTMTADSK